MLESVARLSYWIEWVNVSHTLMSRKEREILRKLVLKETFRLNETFIVLEKKLRKKVLKEIKIKLCTY